ncbi:hypothetical protein YC2023_098292 [Brassica napus]
MRPTLINDANGRRIWTLPDMVITIANTALNNFQWKEAKLIKFRHTHHACVLKHENFLSKIDNWDNPESKLHDSVSGQDVYAAFNPHDYFVTVEKTMVPCGKCFLLSSSSLADTNMESPDDFVKEGVSETYNVAPFSSIPLKSM